MCTNRKHDVNKVYRRIGGEYALVECKYTEDWNLDKKRAIARWLKKLVDNIGRLKNRGWEYRMDNKRNCK